MYDRVPQALKAFNNWVCFRLENRKGKSVKVPYTPTGAHASVNKPQTWACFNDVTGAKGFDGIGFVFNGTPYTGVDIDHCVNHCGELTAEAAAIVKTLNSYTELSPSGTGLHIIVEADLKSLGLKGGRNTEAGVEIYDTGRYFTVTGNVYADYTDIRAAGTELSTVYRKYIGTKEKGTERAAEGEKSALSDTDVVTLACKGKNGDLFTDLYMMGDLSAHNGDHSAADLALCNILAFWCRRDAEQMDRIYRSSSLMREKWDEVHGEDTYGDMTIKRAIADCKEVFDRNTAEEDFRAYTGESLNESASVTVLSTVEERAVDWTFTDYIPRGQVTIMAGEGGSGKTTVWCRIAAAVSNGELWDFSEDSPMYADAARVPQKVMFFSAEDSVSYVLKRRLKANGANLDNCLTIDIADSRFKYIQFNAPFVEQLIAEHRPSLVIFDPLQAFIPATIKMGDRNAMRSCLEPLIGLGERYSCSFLIIVHANKLGGVWGRKRIADSADIWDIARSVLMVGDTDEKGIRYLSHEKSNYSKTARTILFEIEGEKFEKKGYTDRKDKDFITAADRARPTPAKDEAKEFILNFLEDGKKEVSELDSMAKAQGISGITLKRAKAELKKSGLINYSSTGYGKEKTHYIFLDSIFDD